MSGLSLATSADDITQSSVLKIGYESFSTGSLHAFFDTLKAQVREEILACLDRILFDIATLFSDDLSFAMRAKDFNELAFVDGSLIRFRRDCMRVFESFFEKGFSVREIQLMDVEFGQLVELCLIYNRWSVGRALSHIVETDLPSSIQPPMVVSGPSSIREFLQPVSLQGIERPIYLYFLVGHFFERWKASVSRHQESLLEESVSPTPDQSGAIFLDSIKMFVREREKAQFLFALEEAENKNQVLMISRVDDYVFPIQEAKGPLPDMSGEIAEKKMDSVFLFLATSLQGEVRQPVLSENSYSSWRDFFESTLGEEISGESPHLRVMTDFFLEGDTWSQQEANFIRCFPEQLRKTAEDGIPHTLALLDETFLGALEDADDLEEVGISFINTELTQDNKYWVLIKNNLLSERLEELALSQTDSNKAAESKEPLQINPLLPFLSHLEAIASGNLQELTRLVQETKMGRLMGAIRSFETQTPSSSGSKFLKDHPLNRLRTQLLRMTGVLMDQVDLLDKPENCIDFLGRMVTNYLLEENKTVAKEQWEAYCLSHPSNSSLEVADFEFHPELVEVIEEDDRWFRVANLDFPVCLRHAIFHEFYTLVTQKRWWEALDEIDISRMGMQFIRWKHEKEQSQPLITNTSLIQTISDCPEENKTLMIKQDEFRNEKTCERLIDGPELSKKINEYADKNPRVSHAPINIGPCDTIAQLEDQFIQAVGSENVVEVIRSTTHPGDPLGYLYDANGEVCEIVAAKGVSYSFGILDESHLDILRVAQQDSELTCFVELLRTQFPNNEDRTYVIIMFNDNMARVTKENDIYALVGPARKMAKKRKREAKESK